MTPENNNWRLKDFKINFEKGYSFREKESEKIDHYKGVVTFMNGENEEFRLNIDQIKSEEFLAIISDQMLKTTNELVDRINSSISKQLNKQ